MFNAHDNDFQADKAEQEQIWAQEINEEEDNFCPVCNQPYEPAEGWEGIGHIDCN